MNIFESVVPVDTFLRTFVDDPFLLYFELLELFRELLLFFELLLLCLFSRNFSFLVFALFFFDQCEIIPTLEFAIS